MLKGSVAVCTKVALYSGTGFAIFQNELGLRAVTAGNFYSDRELKKWAATTFGSIINNFEALPDFLSICEQWLSDINKCHPPPVTDQAICS